MDLVDIQKLHEFNDGVRYLLTGGPPMSTEAGGPTKNQQN
jgi:hypothetical protein